ncbi:MAG: Nif3-like dinuclear metal center hexameric protein [Psychrosphaera sp.]|nr:Nif3-like dinuclear metal center hexameric protein [Psychrosphaera sp.]
MIKRNELLDYINNTLQPRQIKDYCPNGLQVEGCEQVKKVVTGVTASLALIEAAIERGADTILVHHGYFWKGEAEAIKGMKKQRLKKLLAHDINLLAYHLPLDIHPELGNNAQLANLLGITIERGLEAGNKTSIAMAGRLQQPQTAEEFGATIEAKLGRKPLVVEANKDKIETIALCTGGGQVFIDMAADQSFDAYLSGEASDQTIHTSREMNIHFFAAGHHATERYGVKALGEHLADKFGLDVEFVDIDNPV